MISLTFLFLLNIFSLSAPENASRSEERQVITTNTTKVKFIVFSGSDWCKGCIQFRKKVLEDPSFETFAKENLDIVVADFPQRIKLPQDVVQQNEALAEKYNPKGIFPNLVLLAPDGSRFEVIEYSNQSPQEFVKEIKNHLQHLNG
jgi:thioredoxin-related protein